MSKTLIFSVAAMQKELLGIYGVLVPVLQFIN